MALFNRIVIVVALLAMAVVVTLVCLFPGAAIDLIGMVADQLRVIQPRIALIDQLILIALAAVVDLVLVLWLLVEIRRPSARQVKVQQVDGGTATVSADSIKQRLAFYIDGLADVVQVKPQLDVRGDSVRVTVDVETSAAVSVPAKAREIVSVVEMVVVETMGLKLRGEPVVRIRTGSYRAMPSPAPRETKPLPIPSAPAAQREVVVVERVPPAAVQPTPAPVDEAPPLPEEVPPPTEDVPSAPVRSLDGLASEVPAEEE